MDRHGLRCQTRNVSCRLPIASSHLELLKSLLPVSQQVLIRTGKRL